MEKSGELKKDLILLKSEYDKVQKFVGFEIFCIDELEKGQIGYSVDPNGVSLISEDEGSWSENWIVIGYETLCGDPIVVDLGEDGFPVFSLMHGMGSWEGGTPISDSIKLFSSALISVNQFVTAKAICDSNQIVSPKEIKSLTDRIVNDKGYIYSDSWESLFEPLLKISEMSENETIAKVKQLKEKGLKISEIAMSIGISTKEVYEYLKDLK